MILESGKKSETYGPFAKKNSELGKIEAKLGSLMINPFTPDLMTPIPKIDMTVNSTQTKVKKSNEAGKKAEGVQKLRQSDDILFLK